MIKKILLFVVAFIIMFQLPDAFDKADAAVKNVTKKITKHRYQDSIN